MSPQISCDAIIVCSSGPGNVIATLILSSLHLVRGPRFGPGRRLGRQSAHVPAGTAGKPLKN
jgi:hypothetical protein